MRLPAIVPLVYSTEKGINAAKWLAEKGWDKRSRAGRPSKEEVERNIQIETDIERQFREDLERIGVH
jgi:hypothetical protein